MALYELFLSGLVHSHMMVGSWLSTQCNSKIQVNVGLGHVKLTLLLLLVCIQGSATAAVLDLSGYSFTFRKCHEVVVVEDATAATNTGQHMQKGQRFVEIDLCLNGDCESCSTRMVDLGQYLDVVSNYHYQQMEEYCNKCYTSPTACPTIHHNGNVNINNNNNINYNNGQYNNGAYNVGGYNGYNNSAYNNNNNGGNNFANSNNNNSNNQGQLQQNLFDDFCIDEGGTWANEYYGGMPSSDDECEMMENMAKNGYIDAIQLNECQMIYDPEDPGDDFVDQLYAGAYCASDGKEIKIGVFSDEYCVIRRPNYNVNDYLVNRDGNQMSLSHSILRRTFDAARSVPCLEPRSSGESPYFNAHVSDMCQIFNEETINCSNQSESASAGHSIDAVEEICLLTEEGHDGNAQSDNNNAENHGDVTSLTIDLAGYSALYQGCKELKLEASTAEQGGTMSTMVQVQLCVRGDCDSCSTRHLELEAYLQLAATYHTKNFEAYCQRCYDIQVCPGELQHAHYAYDDTCSSEGTWANEYYDNSKDEFCGVCHDECAKYEHMEENGYIDAFEFFECQMIYDPEDDGRSSLYAGPYCSNDGFKIGIGVFEDEDCLVRRTFLEVDDYLMDGDRYQMKLSHQMLRRTYSPGQSMPCLDASSPNGLISVEDPKFNDLCIALYSESVDCETADSYLSSLCSLLEDADEAPKGFADGTLFFGQCMTVPMSASTSDEPNFELTEEYVQIDQYAVFDLCAHGDCDSCARRYIHLDEYLDYTNKFHSVHFDEYCHKCNDMCNALPEDLTDSLGGASASRRHGGSFLGQQSQTFRDSCSDKVWDNPYAVSDCSVCTSKCDIYDNLSETGFIDALHYIKCWPIHVDDQTGAYLYAGPTCSGEESITIGLFADKDCKYFLPTLDIDDYLGDYQISDILLAKTHMKDPLPCHDMPSPLGMVSSASSDMNLMYTDFDLIAAHNMCDKLDKNAARCDITSQVVAQPRSGNFVTVDNQLTELLCIERDTGNKATNIVSSTSSSLKILVPSILLLQVPVLWIGFL